MQYNIIKKPDGAELAYKKTDPTNKNLPFIMFLGGFMSDMQGSKAEFLEETCIARGQGFIRFDYQGHGLSSGKFTEGTISKWLDDANFIIDNLTNDMPVILIGSSMGGWLSLLLGINKPSRIESIIGIAAAPDFSIDMYNLEFSELQKTELRDNGITYFDSDYGDPYPITKNLMDDANQNLILDKPININCPVRLIQGMRDKSVIPEKANRIKNNLISKDVEIHFIKDGDHSLSRPDDLKILNNVIEKLNQQPINNNIAVSG